ncbi:hypothetical protein V8F06_006360 [Rhypophila decipiens]
MDLALGGLCISSLETWAGSVSWPGNLSFCVFVVWGFRIRVRLFTTLFMGRTFWHSISHVKTDLEGVFSDTLPRNGPKERLTEPAERLVTQPTMFTNRPYGVLGKGVKLFITLLLVWPWRFYGLGVVRARQKLSCEQETLSSVWPRLSTAEKWSTCHSAPPDDGFELSVTLPIFDLLFVASCSTTLRHHT